MKAVYDAREACLYARVTGEFAPSSAREVFLEMVGEARRHSLNRILCDITLLKGFDDDHISFITRFEINRLISKSIPRDIRLAILETPQQYMGGRLGEEILLKSGAAVRVTSDLNEALIWLVTALPEESPRSKTMDRSK